MSSIISNRKVDNTTEYISTLAQKIANDEINLNALYQRGYVWTEVDENEFIQSIFNDLVPTNIILAVNNEGETYNIDGKQRCNTIYKFFNNIISYKINDERIFYSKIPKDNKKKNTRILNKCEKNLIDNRKIFVAKYFDLSYIEQVELFNNLNKGRTLTPGELIAIEYDTESVARKLCTLFDELDPIFSKLTNTKRKNHNIMISRMLYNFDDSSTPAYSKKKIKNYFNEYSDDEIDELIEKFRPKIEHIINNIKWKSIINKHRDIYIENVLVYLARKYKKIKHYSKDENTELVKKLIKKLENNEDITEDKTATNYQSIIDYLDSLKPSALKIPIE